MKSTLANEDNQIESLEKSNNKVQTNPLQNLLKLFKKKKEFRFIEPTYQSFEEGLQYIGRCGKEIYKLLR
jgi:hypothetical protein